MVEPPNIEKVRKIDLWTRRRAKGFAGCLIGGALMKLIDTAYPDLTNIDNELAYPAAAVGVIGILGNFIQRRNRIPLEQQEELRLEQRRAACIKSCPWVDASLTKANMISGLPPGHRPGTTLEALDNFGIGLQSPAARKEIGDAVQVVGDCTIGPGRVKLFHTGPPICPKLATISNSRQAPGPHAL